MSSAYNYNAAIQIFVFFFTMSCHFPYTIMNVCEQPISQLFCDSFSVQSDLGYQEKYDLKFPSTEQEVHSIRIRSIKHKTATYTMINFHSTSKNQQFFFVMIFVFSFLVTAMLLLNTYLLHGAESFLRS